MKKILFLAFLLAVFMTACNKHSHESVENQEEATIQLTAYSAEFEVFAEADPFVVGKESSILSHFSHIPGFHALEKGSVTFRLIVDGKEVSQVLDKPTRKGIYKFNLTPETRGTGKIMFDFKIDHQKYQLEVPDVVVYATEQDANAAANAVVISRTNTTVFTKEQSWKIEFETALPINQSFGQVIKTTALVQSAQGDEAIVTAKAAGVVVFSGENILEGKSVSNGQTLFSIAGNGLASNNSAIQFAEAKNNYDKAAADYERARELAKDKIVSAKDLLATKTQYENSKAIYHNMSKSFNATGQNIKSPMSGFVKQVFVQNGESVEAGQSILTVSQNKTLLLRAEVQQKYTSMLGAIKTANIRTINDNKTYTLDQLNGKVISFGKTANSDNYLIPVILQIDNKGSFISGSFVELYLKCITNTQALTVPNQSLLEEQGVFFVYVQVTPELFEKREVKIGASDGLYTEIMSGISNDERIVSKGAMMIKLAQSTGALDAHSGHNH